MAEAGFGVRLHVGVPSLLISEVGDYVHKLLLVVAERWTETLTKKFVIDGHISADH